MTQQWCAICTGYGDHDTAHHEAGVVISDRVRITSGEYEKREGIIQQVRGPDVIVRLPGRRGNTETVTVSVNDVERIG